VNKFMNKREKALWYTGIVALAVTIALSGCGNTISGVGSDISDIGSKVTTWQKERSEKEETK